MYDPRSSDSAPRTAPVAMFLTSIFAFATVAPDGSVTTPTIWPVSVCAHTPLTSNQAQVAATKKQLNLRISLPLLDGFPCTCPRETPVVEPHVTYPSAGVQNGC